MTRDEFLAKYPDIVMLDPDDPQALTAYLRKREWLAPDQTLDSAQPAGEGNMNCTLRISAGKRSLILKQSRPWVEKYPEIEAPWDRVIREARFYSLVKEHPAVANRMPQILWLDPVSRILACEDLGVARDFTDLYQGATLSLEELLSLTSWLNELHSIQYDEQARESLVNRDMRALNYQHIFSFPLYKDNGLNLDNITPGLQAVANALKFDADYIETVTELGRRYLEDGSTLLHGDYFPGSWLRTVDGVRIIDPEFGFFGLAEFDAGVFFGHLHLAGQESSIIDQFLKNYRPPESFDQHLMHQFAGVEIMRRLIGVAQLPLTIGLDQKIALLELSQRLVLDK